MKIAPKALKTIRQLRRQQGMRSGAGVRLWLKDSGLCLTWEVSGLGPQDLVIRKQGILLFVNAQVYAMLSDYELDVTGKNNARRFVLKHRNG